MRDGTSINIRRSITFLAIWLLLAVVLAALATLLTVAVIADPQPSQDVTVMNWIRGWDLPGISGFSSVVSALTSLAAGLVYSVVGLAALFITRQRKAALAFEFVGAIAAVASFIGDFTLGELVERTRPISGTTTSSYPSGHVFGGTVLFGFLALLPFHHRLRRRFSVPIFLLPGLLVVGVGPSRIYEGDHWPSDAAAAYLLASILLMMLIPLYRRYVATGFEVSLKYPWVYLGADQAESGRDAAR